MTHRTDANDESPFRPIEPKEFPWFDYGRYTFSLGLRHGDCTYLSGHSASIYDATEERIIVRGGMAEQARTAYAKVEHLLEAAGLGMDDVVHVVENVTVDGLPHYASAAQARLEVFADHSPAVSTVCVDRLLRPSAWLEVEVVAARGSGEASDGEQRPTPAPVRAADGVIYLPSCLPIDENGELIASGNLVAQTEQCYENAARMLAAIGLDTSHITKTVDFIAHTEAANTEGIDPVRREHFNTPYPAAASILMGRLPIDGALVQVEVLASRHKLTAIDPGWKRYEDLTSSPAVRAGDALFISGQVAQDQTTQAVVHPGDIAAQAEYCYRKVLTILEMAGAGPQHLVKTTEYVTADGLPRYRAVGDVRKRLLTSPFPASTGLVCGGLARPELLVEIDPMALLNTED